MRMQADRPEAHDLGFVHRFVPGTDPSRAPLLVLHGTGGDESDLIPLARRLSPGAAILSPRGPVLENGMPRFFRRHAEGVFDLGDVERRAGDLARFVAAARSHYGLEKPIAVGFSNGANIAAAMMLTAPETLAGAVLFRAMTTISPTAVAGLDGVGVLMLSGASDPIVPAASRERLADMLRRGGAEVTDEVLPAGHGLTPADLAIAGDWLSRR